MCPQHCESTVLQRKKKKRKQIYVPRHYARVFMYILSDFMTTL